LLPAALEPEVVPVEPVPEALLELLAGELDRPPPAPIEVSSMIRHDRQSALAVVTVGARASKAVV
jgi:hypothetical protein